MAWIIELGILCLIVQMAPIWKRGKSSSSVLEKKEGSAEQRLILFGSHKQIYRKLEATRQQCARNTSRDYRLNGIEPCTDVEKEISTLPSILLVQEVM